MYRAVMVIDDSPLERFLAETIITNSRFAEKVLSYNSALDALRYLKEIESSPVEFPDVIFVDIQMPVMTGFDFLDGFLELSYSIKRHCKIVMISSTKAHEDFIRMKRYPIISKFLPKPLSEQMFKDLVL